MNDIGFDPLVSVIVVTYNQEKTVGRTLEGILAQKTDFPFEIILGEDASPSDNTRSVCEAYAAAHPAIIRLMPKAPNKGLLRNYDDCLHECRGRYIATCAGDDWWHNEDKLQMQVGFLESHPDYGMVHTNIDTYDVQKQILIPAIPRNPPQGNVYKELFKYSFVFAPTAVYRRTLLDHIDFTQIRNAGIHIEDYPMWLEFARHSKIKYFAVSTVTYSVIENSVSHPVTLEARLTFVEQVHLIHKFYIERYPDESPSQAQADIFYNRLVYMMLLKFKQYARARTMVGKLGFSKPLCFALRMPWAGQVVRLILESDFYRRMKKL